MLRLILTHHVTAPSPPISPQTREDKKKSTVVCRLTLRLAQAPAIGHRHTHPQSEARTPPAPGTVKRADSWHTLHRPPPASRSPFLTVTLTLLTYPGTSPRPRKLFFKLPSQELPYRYRPSLVQSSNKGPFVTILLPDSHPTAGIHWPSVTQGSPKKKEETTRAPSPDGLWEGWEEAAFPAAANESGRWQSSELPAR